LKNILKSILPTIVLAAALGTFVPASAAGPKSAVADADLADFLAKRMQQWQPTVAERVFDDIAWVKDIREALRLSKQHKRPVFLFTHDGRINIGRC
jgi:hypothetical protein